MLRPLRMTAQPCFNWRYVCRPVEGGGNNCFSLRQKNAGNFPQVFIGRPQAVQNIKAGGARKNILAEGQRDRVAYPEINPAQIFKINRKTPTLIYDTFLPQRISHPSLFNNSPRDFKHAEIQINTQHQTFASPCHFKGCSTHRTANINQATIYLFIKQGYAFFQYTGNGAGTLLLAKRLLRIQITIMSKAVCAEMLTHGIESGTGSRTVSQQAFHS